MKEELEKQKAYQLGFYDGFTVGVEDNTFDDDMDRHLYRLGYDAGVAEYCWEKLPEEKAWHSLTRWNPASYGARPRRQP